MYSTAQQQCLYQCATQLPPAKKKIHATEVNKYTYKYKNK